MTICLPREIDGPLAVEVSELSSRYGRKSVLNGLNLAVPEGAVYALAGPNGSGKSTTLHHILGMQRASTGTIRVRLNEVLVRGAELRAMTGLVASPGPHPYSFLTIGELFRHYTSYYPSWDDGYARYMSGVLKLDTARKVGDASMGEARRVHIVTALAHRPALLLLDEPTSGLDPEMRERVLRMLLEYLADINATVLIATNTIGDFEAIVDHVGVINQGQLVAQLTSDLLRARLRRYHIETPDGWTGNHLLADSVLSREAQGRIAQWVIWGDEDETAHELRAGGAFVRSATPLTLEAAVQSLLDPSRARTDNVLRCTVG